MPTHVDDDAAVDPEVLEAFKALSNPVRLRILHWLRDPRAHFPQERAIANPDEVGVCVSHITEKAQLAQSTVSAYMSTLESAGLVISTRVGKWTHYRRDEERIQQFVGLLGRQL